MQVSTSSPSAIKYTSPMHCFRHLLATEGVMGLTRGMGATMAREVRAVRAGKNAWDHSAEGMMMLAGDAIIMAARNHLRCRSCGRCCHHKTAPAPAALSPVLVAVLWYAARCCPVLSCPFLICVSQVPLVLSVSTEQVPGNVIYFWTCEYGRGPAPIAAPCSLS